MLQIFNECIVYKQKLHPNLWFSWGIQDENEEMKELVEDM
jgi:hypothetical protein